MRQRRTWVLGASIVAIGLFGCQGIVTTADPTDRARRGVDCGESNTGLAQPMLRLTGAQYNNAVRDLLGDTSDPANAFPAEEELGGIQVAGLVSDAQFEHYQLAAQNVASGAIGDLAGLTECGALSGRDCTADFVARFGRRMYRRSLTTTEIDRLVALYETIEAAEGTEAGFETLVSALLQSPNFLYRPEFSESPEARALTGYERATRLSFFLWNSVPDDELLDGAEAGMLDTPDGVAAQAERMLEDARASRAMRQFFARWLELDLDEVQKAESVVADFGPIRAAAQGEFDAFIDHFLFETDGTLPELFTADYAFVNRVTAPLYGVEGEFGDAFERVDLDPTQRRGVLTMLPMLIDHSGSDNSAPILRGVFIRRRILCGTLPEPPDSIEFPEIEEGVTARERLAQQRQSPVCGSCHQQIDHLGLPFESYDALGRFRTTEYGLPIQTRGEINFTEHSDARVADALELSDRLAESPDVAACATESFFQSATGRFPLNTDACALDEASAAFEASGYSFRSLIIALVQTDAFLNQGTTEEESP